MCDLSELEEFSKKKISADNSNFDELDKMVISHNFLNAGLAYIHSGWGVMGKVYPNTICKLFIQYILNG